MKCEICGAKLPPRRNRNQIFFTCEECGHNNEYYANPFRAPGVRKWTNRVGWGCAGMVVFYVVFACSPIGMVLRSLVRMVFSGFNN